MRVEQTNRMLRFADLKARRIVSNRMTLRRWVAEGRFPAPVALGPNTLAWRESEVAEFVESCAAEGREGGPKVGNRGELSAGNAGREVNASTIVSCREVKATSDVVGLNQTQEDSTMRVSDIFQSRYLKADDLKGRDLHVTISGYEVTKLDGDPQAKPDIGFRETEKLLRANKTNTITIEALHGQELDDWIGKRITLFPTKVQYQGQVREGIRVRDRVPPGGKAAPPPKAEDSAGSAEEWGISDDDIRYTPN
jgi:prophage regulatory protein